MLVKKGETKQQDKEKAGEKEKVVKGARRGRRSSQEVKERE